MSGGAGANARGVQRLPLAAGTQHVAYAIGASPAGRSGPAAAQRMGIHPLGNQRGQRRPQLIGYLKGAGGGVGRCGRASALGSRWLGFWHFGHSPSLASTASPCLSCSGGFALVFRIGSYGAGISTNARSVRRRPRSVCSPRSSRCVCPFRVDAPGDHQQAPKSPGLEIVMVP